MPEAMHDFTAKLRRPDVLPHVMEALSSLSADAGGDTPPGPLSINLDLTTSCNYRCDHCIDAALLNGTRPFDVEVVLRSLHVLRAAGLRSVILIGGGEPTLHPRFVEVVEEIKALGLACGIVSNGSRNGRITQVATALTMGDWVRLSLDAGSDATFQVMHRPRQRLSLDHICETATQLKAANRQVSLGFSFIISWADELSVGGTPLVDNVDEVAAAAQLARDAGFDYIAYKPMLQRDRNGAEVVRFPRGKRGEAVRTRVGRQLAAARELATATFKVVGSVNLGAVEAESAGRNQPTRCYMHLFRQVLTPDGIYGCPAYRGDDRDRIGAPDGYATPEGAEALTQNLRAHIEAFDVSRECRNIACLYNSTNWWLDGVYASDEVPDPVTTTSDVFL